MRERGRERRCVYQGVYLTLHRTAVCMYVQCYCMQAILMEGRRCSSEDFPSSQQYVHYHIQTIPQRVLGRLRSVYLIISHTYTIHTTGILSSYITGLIMVHTSCTLWFPQWISSTVHVQYTHNIFNMFNCEFTQHKILVQLITQPPQPGHTSTCTVHT